MDAPITELRIETMFKVAEDCRVAPF